MAASKADYDTIIKPIQTEKSAGLIAEGVYTFEVSKDSNKHSIKKAVEAIWNVEVTKVRVNNTKGETRRNRLGNFTTKSYRKAMVTLAEGHEIEIL